MKELWVEKYRPSTIEGYVFRDSHQREQVKTWIKEKSIPHLLFSGSAGIGKTTLAKILFNELEVNDLDLLEINASRTNSVDDVRDKIINFVQMIPFGDFKVVLLDEADYLSPNAQAALRGVMEEYHTSARFILTCNYIEKIIEPIQSRCQTFQITPPTKKDVAVQISKILTEERIQFELKELVPIVDSSYPDIRKIINTCQLNSSKGILKIDSSSISDADVRVKIIDILKSKDDKRNRYVNLRQAVADSRIQDFTELYT